MYVAMNRVMVKQNWVAEFEERFRKRKGQIGCDDSPTNHAFVLC